MIGSQTSGKAVSAVVDQAGFKIVFIGLCISLFFGLIIRAQIRSTVIKAKIQKNLIAFQKDYSLDFETAEVTLSDWGIPRPVIEIRGLRVSPLNYKCDENQIYIQSLSLPLNFSLLLSEAKTISNIHLSLVEVRSKNLDECLSKQTEQQQIQPPQLIPQQSKQTPQNMGANEVNINSLNQTETNNTQRLNTELDEIKIDRLRIISTGKAQTALDLNAVQINFKYVQNKLQKIAVSSQLLAFKEPLKNYFLLKSDLKMNVELDKQPRVVIDLKGLILDKAFDFKIKNDPEKNSIQVLGEFNNISLKVLNNIVRIENPKAESYDFLSGSSVSGFLTGEYLLKNKSLDLSFKKLKVLFSGGTLEVNELSAEGSTSEAVKDAFVIKPFDVQLNHIDLTKILSYPLFDKIRPSIQNAGFLSGQIQYLGKNQFKIKSLLEKSTFIFSNKGNQVNQTFDSFNLSILVDPSKLLVSINDFILDNQKIQGFAKYSQKKSETDAKLTEKSLNVDLEGKLLKPDTVELFTGFNYQPNIKIQISSNLTSFFKGTAEMDTLQIHQFEFSRVVADFTKDLISQKEIYNIKSAKTIISESDDEDAQQFNVFFNQDLLPGPKLELTNARMTLQKDESTDMLYSIKADNKNLNLTIIGKMLKSIGPNKVNGKVIFKFLSPKYAVKSFQLDGDLNKFELLPLK